MSQQQPRFAESLNALIRVELAAIPACQQALRILDGELGEDSEKVLGLTAGHRRNVAALRACILTLGGTPETEPAATWSPFALLRDRKSVQQLLRAEASVLARYEVALQSMEGDVRELIEGELIPRQRRHIGALSRILDSLSPA
ncbi:MAG: hypothetical protein L6R30_03265 [Thermoanaerobaculia bacterium]|nr:hypothetical protein [Thermoanaerobaculia bacterium]